MGSILNIFPKMTRKVPEGRAGLWSVSHFTITKSDASLANGIAALRPGGRMQAVAPGRYARLQRGQAVVMSDTDMERRTNWKVANCAHGDVLIAGLGLGMILHPIARKPEVDSVTVIEQAPDVIKLIGPTIKSRKVQIIEGDINTWRPPKGTRYGTIYFDIWPDQCTDDLKEMARLHRVFGRYLDKADDARWMGSWCRDLLRYLKSRGL